jgi:retron-type reverse transcriptase
VHFALTVPTVTDRLIQQAIAQVLTPLFDPKFSEHSYGFRPRRRGHDAVRKAKTYMTEGYRFVVDLDLEKFFDRVHHDRLMRKLAARVKDKKVLLLIRKYLQAGVMEDGLVRWQRKERRKVVYAKLCIMNRELSQVVQKRKLPEERELTWDNSIGRNRGGSALWGNKDSQLAP